MLKEQIIQAKEKIGRKAAELIAQELNIEQWDDTTGKGLCPFHSEHTPSFVWNDKDNAFKCFGSCGTRYGILDHFQQFHHYTTHESLRKLFSMADMNYSIEYKKPEKYRFPHPENEITSEEIISYFIKRGIDKTTLDIAKVKQDEKGNIAFEFYDDGDTLLLVKYRPARKIQKGENKTWCQANADTTPVLWGMNQAIPSKPLIITEGEMDRLALIQCGFTNVVSIPLGAQNVQWIEYNWEWLEQFDEIIICADNDKAGTKMLEETIPRLGDWRCKTIEYPKLKYNNKDFTPKDLNEILVIGSASILSKVINEATDVPIKNVRELSQVEDVDLSTLQGINCGIDGISVYIDKFFLGTLTVLTGRRSGGKSSIVNQMCVCEAVNQGYKTFIYSGELIDYQLKKWIEYPMAGRDYITKYNTGENRPPVYEIHEEAKKRMAEWYKDRIFVYDNVLDARAEVLMDTMKNMARKHGVKNFVIDNLMTVDIDGYDKTNSNKNEKAFVLDLVKFALKFNVCVFLIAHPRKQSEGDGRLRNDDVSGSGDITNLAHYCIALHRVTDHEHERDTNPIEHDVIITILKNRLMGYQDKDIGVYFDISSRRFYENEKQLKKRYKWDKRE